jgi:hypothetical protein
MNINEFHSIPRGNKARDKILSDLADGATLPIALQRRKRRLVGRGIRGLGPKTAKQIIQAICIKAAELSAIENNDKP